MEEIVKIECALWKQSNGIPLTLEQQIIIITQWERRLFHYQKEWATMVN